MDIAALQLPQQLPQLIVIRPPDAVTVGQVALVSNHLSSDAPHGV
jgi:hypothetical protein